MQHLSPVVDFCIAVFMMVRLTRDYRQCVLPLTETFNQVKIDVFHTIETGWAQYKIELT